MRMELTIHLSVINGRKATTTREIDTHILPIPDDMGADEVSFGSAKPTIVRWYEVEP